MKRITYQGVKGAYSYLAALAMYGEENHFCPAPTFKKVFECVKTGQANLAVLPIENSLIGSIYENYDHLSQYDMQIVGEYFAKIEHCLLSAPSQEESHVRLQKIKRVLSHPKALEQCRHFFQHHEWMEAVAYVDTAAAAEEIARNKDPRDAAIASYQAGEIYGLDVVAENIADDPRNYTRFVVVSPRNEDDSQADKCSLLLHLNHSPGALVEALEGFASQRINLTKIESRPLRGSLFEYAFYVDLEFDKSERRILEKALQAIKEKVNNMQILGLYKKGIIWSN